MSDITTHLAAIGVGVAIAFMFFGGSNNKQQQQQESSSSDAPEKAAAPTKKKNKKKKKKSATATNKAEAPAPAAEKKAPGPAPAPKPAPVPAPAPVAEAPKAAAPAPAAATGGKKKKNKSKKNGAAAASAAPATNGASKAAPAPAPKPAPAPAPKQAPAPAPAVVPLQPRIVVEEEWATIPKKSKKKKNNAAKKQQEAAAASESGAAAESTKISVTVTIDASRVGIIIGPKGATMIAIQEKTGTKLDVNAPKPDEKAAAAGNSNQFRPVVGGKSKSTAKATVVITEGTTEGQKAAKKAILELADRGYAALLQAEGFGESSVSVHPRFLSEIVGTGGKIIKAIQSELDVKLTIPKTDWTPKTLQIGNTVPSVRVGIAGDIPANVKKAKQVIKDICAYHHHEITHPGLVHQEVYVPQEFFHCVIGTRGSEIKHIRGNYNVDVYMPSNESWCVTENVICVGKSNDVEKAISYIKLLMDRDTELREQKYSDEGFGDDSMGW